MAVQLTVALPIWNSQKIAWIAIEGLCNQKNIDFEWELLIIEEQELSFGHDEIRKFTERLRAVGCVSVKYYALEYRIPLSHKWKYIANMRSQTSIVYLLQAADCYSYSNRLRDTMDAALNGYDWIQNRQGYFYNVHLGKTILFDQKTFGNGCRTGLNMAVACTIVDKLDNNFIWQGVDNWFYNCVQPQKVFWIEDCPPDGVDIDGLNNISKERKLFFQNTKPPFIKTDVKIEEILPKFILEKLKQIQ